MFLWYVNIKPVFLLSCRPRPVFTAPPYVIPAEAGI